VKKIVYMLYIYIIVQLMRNLEICEVYIILSLSFYKYLNKKVLKNDLLYIYIKTINADLYYERCYVCNNY